MNVVFSIDGVQSTLLVYEDRLVLAKKSFTETQKAKASIFEGLSSLVKSDDKVIMFDNIQSINFSKPTLLGSGHLVFNLGSGIGLSKFGASLSGNSFLFDKKSVDTALEVKQFIEKRIQEIQAAKNSPKITQAIIQSSPADELKKFKQLLDEGIISQEEFNAKKKELLNI